MKVTTAVVFAAGFGSRMLPVTSAVQKELLPILDRPIIDYVVSDCIAAGITNIIFVIRPNSHGLQDFYTGNSVLEGHLKRFGKDKDLARLEQIHSQATYTFVEQRADAGYGTAVPLQVAADHLPTDEAFIVCGSDDFMWRTDGGSDLKDLVEAFDAADADGALMTIEKPDDELFKYGVLAMEKRDGREYFRSFVEKPSENAPSNLINISKYILTPKLLKYVLEVEKDSKSGEFYITDAVNDAAQEHDIVIHRAHGQYLDGGGVAGWLEANLVVAQSRPELAKRFGVYNS